MGGMAPMLAMMAASSAQQTVQQNQALEQQEAQLEHEQAADDASQVMRHRTRMQQLAAILSGQRAGLSASGVDPSSGSGLALAAGSTRDAFQESADDADLAERARVWRRYNRQQIATDRSLLPLTAATGFAQKAIFAASMSGAFDQQQPAGGGQTTRQLSTATGGGASGGSSYRRSSQYRA